MVKELVLSIGSHWFCPAHPVYSQAADLSSSWLSLPPANADWPSLPFKQNPAVF